MRNKNSNANENSKIVYKKNQEINLILIHSLIIKLYLSL